MVCHCLAPGMQDGSQTDFRAEPLGIGGDRLQCLSRHLHQQSINDRLVLESDLRDRRRQGKDDMEVRDGQEVGDTSSNPLSASRPLALWAMAIATGIVGDAGHATIITSINVPTKTGRPARFDCSHDPSFASA